VRDHIALSLFDDFENFSVFRPRPLHEKSVAAMLEKLVAWGGALRGLRSAVADPERRASAVTVRATRWSPWASWLPTFTRNSTRFTLSGLS
jgi:hypothetical protein